MAEARSEFLKTNTMMTRSEFKNFLHETRSGFAQSNPKRKRPSHPSNSVKDLRLKRVCVDVDDNVKSDVQDNAKKSSANDVNESQFESKQCGVVPQEMSSNGLSSRNLVDVNVGQIVQISDEVKLENPNENKLETLPCPRPKLVENSSSVSFRKLLPYLKNLTKDESSGIKICHSYDRSSNNEKVLLQDVNIMGELDRVKAAEASDEMNVCCSLVNKTGIISSLQSRLIGNLNSPSYKRLLPYLNDLAKDDSDNINTPNCHCNLVKVQNSTNEIHCQSSTKQSHSVTAGDTLDNVVVDDKDPVLERDISYSLEVPHKPINAKLIDGQLDEISMEIQKGMVDLSKNGAKILDVLVDNNIDIVQSTSPDANIHVDSPMVEIKDTILERDSSHSLEVPHKPTNEELNDRQIGKNSKENQKRMDDLSKNDVEILEVLVNHKTDSIQSPFPDANIYVDNPLVDNNIERNSSCSLEDSHKPINEELNDGKIDEIGMEGQKEMHDLSTNNAHIVELSVSYNTDIVQSTSPDGNILKYKDSFQSTPPDTDMVNKLDDKCIFKSSPSDLDFASELNAVEGRRVAALVDGMPKKNLSPDSFLRSKLYRNSSSFSYRRLLPYLASLATSETNVLDVTHSQSPMAKAENELGEKAVLFNDIPLAAVQNHTHSSRDCNLKKNHICEDLDDALEGNNHLCNNAKAENFTTDVILTESSDFEFEMAHKMSSDPEILINLSIDELSGGTMDMNKEHFKEFSTCKIGGNQTLSSIKGILKKYSKGCKGKCTCLDCELHRVNAEKAFEFSRNQMLSANEVVDGLIKELSCLRKTMEKSVATMVNGAESCTVLHVDQKQVKGVCQRAQKVEEQAKSYMRQMFSDLNNHCRSPRPRVTFSDMLQEKSHP